MSLMELSIDTIMGPKFVTEDLDKKAIQRTLLMTFKALEEDHAETFQRIVKKINIIVANNADENGSMGNIKMYTWIGTQVDHTIDAIRAEEAFSSKLGYEEHIPEQTKDWNERANFKVHPHFKSAATRGATAVIDGNVMAINPGEEAKMQMLIWNNIFFSLRFDVKDVAALVAPRNDLQGVKVYNAVDLEGLFTVHTVVLDYRGYRVTAQSIIPSILERVQEQSVVYGFIDFGKTVITQTKYLDPLQKAGNQLKILPHKVVNDIGDEVELCKGIISNDERHYIINLLRTFSPNVNFLKVPEMTLSKETQALGFPMQHKHKLSCLKQEMIDVVLKSRYMMFIKYAAVQLQQLGLKRQMNQPHINAELPTIAPVADKKDKEKKLTEKESKMKEDEANEFDIRISSKIATGINVKIMVPSFTPGMNQMNKNENVMNQNKLLNYLIKYLSK